MEYGLENMESEKLEKFLSKLEQEKSKFGDYSDFVDIRAIFANKIYERLKKCDFTEKELDYLFKKEDLIKYLFNRDMLWNIETNQFESHAEHDIGYFLNEQRFKEKYNKNDEEM